MKLIELTKIVSDESETLKYLERVSGIKASCQHCGSTKFYYMKSKNRIRCAGCKKDIRPFINTLLGKIKITYSKWLVVIKLFELSVSANEAMSQTGLSYKTILKAYDVLRRAIVMELAKTDKVLKGEIEADEAYFGGKRKGKRGRGAKNKVIVFGMLERRGKVSLDILPNVKGETLMNATVAKAKKGSMVYTDQWKGYDALIFHGYKHKTVNHKKMFARGKVYINTVEGFWSFAKERMIKYHGVSRKKFILYIKEMEWRYNNRNRDLFELLTSYMLGASHP